MDNLPIAIPNIPPPTVKVFFKGKFVKECNEYELNDIRIQIKKGQIPGFTMFDDLDQKHIQICKNGYAEKWPIQFDLMVNQLSQI